jgi:AraC-like DNA-binding protein
LTIDGERSLAWAEALGVSARARQAGACPGNLFDELETAVCKNTLEGEMTASARAYHILLLAFGGTAARRVFPIVRIQRIHFILSTQFSDRSLTVDGLAARHGLHRSTLYRQFRDHYGLTPKTFLIRKRVQHALSLLKETALPVQEIAMLSGFTDIAHFSKSIKAATGYSPRSFRAERL